MKITSLVRGLICKTQGAANKNQIRAAHAVACIMIAIFQKGKIKERERGEFWNDRYRFFLGQIVGQGADAIGSDKLKKGTESAMTRLRIVPKDEQEILKVVISTIQHGADAILAEIHRQHQAKKKRKVA